MVVLSPADVERYHRDGLLVVRGLLDPDALAAARAGIDRVLAAPGPLAQVASGEDDPGRFVEDFRRWEDIEEFRALAVAGTVPAVAEQLLRTWSGEEPIRFYHDHVLVKEGGTNQRTPWHQDQPYYNVDGHGTSAWIPVDPVPEAGCLELVAGSHLGAWKLPRTFLTEQAKWFPEGSLEELPDVEANRESFDIRAAALAPGDAIFFDFLTFHGAPGFPFNGQRRVLSLRYLAGDATHAPRPWVTSPPFDELVGVVPDGAALDHPLFPAVSTTA